MKDDILTNSIPAIPAVPTVPTVPTITTITTASGSHPLSIRLADTFSSRLRGSMLAPPLRPGHGILLARCSSVHTCFMRQAIDLLYLDGEGVVTRCVPHLRPWRFSLGRTARLSRLAGKAVHVLELPAGSVARMEIACGSRVRHAIFVDAANARLPKVADASSTARVPEASVVSRIPGQAIPRERSKSAGAVAAIGEYGRERGSAMIEFAVVAPIITLMGLGAVQYGLMFVTKNQYNHAAFMAARAGSLKNANLDAIKDAYAQALVPVYGGGGSAAEIAASLARAKADITANARIDILNPTAESFADFNDQDLQKKLGTGSKRVIPNGGLASKKPAIVEANSGQNIQDANLLKIRITQGYKPQVPIIGAVYARYLKWLDTGISATQTTQIDAGLVPIVSHVTLQMQSDAIEDSTVSSPGAGNGGTASDPGTPAGTSAAAPTCGTTLCTEAPAAGAGDVSGSGTAAGGGSDPVADPGSNPGGDGGQGGTGSPPGICTVPA